MTTSSQARTTPPTAGGAAVIMQTFATPVARVAWPLAEQANGAIGDLVLSRLDPLAGELAYKSETPTDLAHWDDPTIDALTRWVRHVARQFVETVAGQTLDAAFAASLGRVVGGRITGGSGSGGEGTGGEGTGTSGHTADGHAVSVTVGRSWASVYHTGDRHEAHYHPNTAVAAIYYVAAPGTCELDLLDPRPNIDYFDPGITLAGDGHRVRLRSRPGDLVLFPGWLRHAVPEFTEEGVRISLSWNLGYATSEVSAG